VVGWKWWGPTIGDGCVIQKNQGWEGGLLEHVICRSIHYMTVFCFRDGKVELLELLLKCKSCPIVQRLSIASEAFN
jgi:hypothetical protein